MPPGSLQTTPGPLRLTPEGAFFIREEPPLAKILPETAEGLLDHMAELFPEPLGTPKWDVEEMRWKLAQRAAYLTVRRQYDALKRRS